MAWVPLKFLGRMGFKAGDNVLRLVIYVVVAVKDVVMHIVERVAATLYSVIKFILSKIGFGGKLFMKLVVIPLQGLNSAYFLIFKLLMVGLKRLGIVGELIFTIFGLAYVLWPLYVAYTIGGIQFYIPAIILTGYLTIYGRKVAMENS